MAEEQGVWGAAVRWGWKGSPGQAKRVTGTETKGCF